jgi:hypothetical protein
MMRRIIDQTMLEKVPTTHLRRRADVIANDGAENETGSIPGGGDLERGRRKDGKSTTRLPIAIHSRQ